MKLVLQILIIIASSIPLYSIQEKRCAIDIGSGAMKVQMVLFDTEKTVCLNC